MSNQTKTMKKGEKLFRKYPLKSEAQSQTRSSESGIESRRLSNFSFLISHSGNMASTRAANAVAGLPEELSPSRSPQSIPADRFLFTARWGQRALRTKFRSSA